MQFKAPTALEYFASLVAHDAALALLEAAASLAQDAYPAADPQTVLSEVDALAATLGRRLPADAAPMQRLRLLNHYFFEELRFEGNVNDYDDPRNSYLCDVLARRRGIPVSLGVLYIELASQAGLAVEGVAAPGHFLVRLHLPQGEVVIDPFTGRSLSLPELEERMQFWRVAPDGSTADDAALAQFLRPATPREVITRMLRNLVRIHEQRGDDLALLAVRDRLVTLLPDDWRERRDRGLVRGRVGQIERARADLEAYLAHAPQAQDAADVARQLLAWRDAPPGTLH